MRVRVRLCRTSIPADGPTLATPFLATLNFQQDGAVQLIGSLKLSEPGFIHSDMFDPETPKHVGNMNDAVLSLDDTRVGVFPRIRFQRQRFFPGPAVVHRTDDVQWTSCIRCGERQWGPLYLTPKVECPNIDLPSIIGGRTVERCGCCRCGLRR